MLYVSDDVLDIFEHKFQHRTCNDAVVSDDVWIFLNRIHGQAQSRRLTNWIISSQRRLECTEYESRASFPFQKVPALNKRDFVFRKEFLALNKSDFVLRKEFSE